MKRHTGATSNNCYADNVQVQDILRYHQQLDYEPEFSTSR